MMNFHVAMEKLTHRLTMIYTPADLHFAHKHGGLGLEDDFPFEMGDL